MLPLELQLVRGEEVTFRCTNISNGILSPLHKLVEISQFLY